LFIRNNRSVRLTPAGAAFLEGAVEIVKTMETTIEKARLANSGLIGKLTVGLASPDEKIFPPIIQSFRKEHPQIEISLLNHYNIGPLAEALRDKQLDVAFLITTVTQDQPDLLRKPIYSNSVPLSAVLPAEHPLASLPEIDLRDLAEEHYVILDPEANKHGYDYSRKVCQDHGFTPEITCQTHNWDSLIHLVASGIGITLLPGNFDTYANDRVVFVNVKNKMYDFTTAATWKKENRNPCLPLFLTYLDQIKMTWAI